VNNDKLKAVMNKSQTTGELIARFVVIIQQYRTNNIEPTI